ncbi:MAG: hypothetical protein ABJB12_02995 [Pseudomonadota bacterium]
MTIALVIVAVVVFLIIRVAAANQGVLALERKGQAARGLVLACDRVSLGRTINGRRFEQFTMTLDVELYAGGEPYVCSGAYLVPRGQVEPVPGASLELMVDPKNKNQLLVIGPGGFSGPWLRVGVPNAY